MMCGADPNDRVHQKPADDQDRLAARIPVNLPLPLPLQMKRAVGCRQRVGHGDLRAWPVMSAQLICQGLGRKKCR
jgi:hypothetical protein